MMTMRKTNAVVVPVEADRSTQIPINVDVRRHAPAGVNDLTPHMTNVLLELTKHYGDQLLGVKVLGNQSEVDQSQFPSGMAMYFDRNAPVNVMSLAGDSVCAMVTSKILLRKGERLDDKFFTERLPKLQSAVPQYSEAPITLGHRDPKTFEDSDHWKEELGPSGSVGVTKQAINAKTNAYYLYAMCSTPVLGQQIVDQIAKESSGSSGMTWGQLAKDPRTLYWRNSVMRNAARVLFTAAQHLGVMIATEYESGTFRETADQAPHTVADLEAEGSVRQFISDICPVEMQSSRRDAIGQFIHCAPVSKLGASKYCLVAESPYEGFIGVRMRENDINMREASVFPTTTGKQTPSAALDFSEAALSKHTLEDIGTQYVWEGKPDKLDVNGASRTLNDRVHPQAYRACDNAFLKAQFFDHGVVNTVGITERFVPVIAKVANKKQRPTNNNNK